MLVMSQVPKPQVKEPASENKRFSVNLIHFIAFMIIIYSVGTRFYAPLFL